MPITSVRASSVTTFSEKPNHEITQKVGISDSGMASAAMTVARQSRRNRNTTRAARIMPSISTSCVAWKLALVSSVIEKTLVIFRPGLDFSSRAMPS